MPDRPDLITTARHSYPWGDPQRSLLVFIERAIGDHDSNKCGPLWFSQTVSPDTFDRADRAAVELRRHHAGNGTLWTMRDELRDMDYPIWNMRNELELVKDKASRFCDYLNVHFRSFQFEEVQKYVRRKYSSAVWRWVSFGATRRWELRRMRLKSSEMSILERVAEFSRWAHNWQLQVPRRTLATEARPPLESEASWQSPPGPVLMIVPSTIGPLTPKWLPVFDPVVRIHQAVIIPFWVQKAVVSVRKLGTVTRGFKPVAGSWFFFW